MQVDQRRACVAGRRTQIIKDVRSRDLFQKRLRKEENERVNTRRCKRPSVRKLTLMLPRPISLLSVLWDVFKVHVTFSIPPSPLRNLDYLREPPLEGGLHS